MLKSNGSSVVPRKLETIRRQNCDELIWGFSASADWICVESTVSSRFIVSRYPSVSVDSGEMDLFERKKHASIGSCAARSKIRIGEVTVRAAGCGGDYSPRCAHRKCDEATTAACSKPTEGKSDKARKLHRERQQSENEFFWLSSRLLPLP